MPEILARIAPNSQIELIRDDAKRIDYGVFTPFDAAYLARAMLACAAALSGKNHPSVGAVCGDAHLPIMQWAVGASNFTGDPVMVLSFPPGIELTFALTRAGAKELGTELLRQTDGVPPLEHRTGTVH